MKFNPSFLDEIRARVPVSEVVRQKVAIKKQGREWRGLSPFNSERTPSFYVDDPKGFFHDFSSGKHGDGFTFLMETEEYPLPEAVAGQAGLARYADAGDAEAREGQEARDAGRGPRMGRRAFPKAAPGSAGARGPRLPGEARDFARGAGAISARLRRAPAATIFATRSPPKAPPSRR